MKKIAMFNHKGGVGKTTLTVNIADALADMGKKVLLVDADPQCNLSAFYLNEGQLEALLGASDDASATLWSAVKPVVEGRGSVVKIPVFDVHESGNIFLLPGDVMLAEYEEVLPGAWNECFAGRTRGYDVTMALSHLVAMTAKDYEVDVVLYDVGPNVGALNRVVLLDCDHFVTPVAADLFSLRALTTVGRAMVKWITDWAKVLAFASPTDRKRLFAGRPSFIGYITSAFKVNAGRSAATSHANWESRIAPRVRDRVVKLLQAIDPKLVPATGSNKIGGAKHFHSLAPEGQRFGKAIGKLKGKVNPGNNGQIDEALQQFSDLSAEIAKRSGI